MLLCGELKGEVMRRILLGISIWRTLFREFINGGSLIRGIFRVFGVIGEFALAYYLKQSLYFAFHLIVQHLATLKIYEFFYLC